MSEKIDITIDSSIDAEAGSEIVSTSSDNNIDIDISEPEYNVTINKREYVITGDNMYIPKTYDESPQWLKDIIGTITDFSLNQKLSEIGALSSTLYALIDELEVAKNTYTNSIITSAEIDERINSRLETLNSSIAESDATIVDLISTKATPTEASSLALNVLTASINDGAISSLVSNLQNAISTTNSTLSNNIDIVHSEMTGDFEATSDAISGLQTYIGVDNDGTANGTGLLSDVKILQKQNDGVIETNTGTWDVMIGIESPNNNTDNDQLDIDKEPYATWKSIDALNDNSHERSSHVGDVYIKYTNAIEGYKTYDRAYKFIKVAPDATSPYSTDAEGFTWAVITDTDVQNAYVAALNALDLADNKRRVFVDTPTIPYDSGDLWVRVVNGSNQIWRCNFDGAASYSVAHWTLASTDDNAVVLLANGTTPINLTNAFVGTTPLDEYLGSEIDGKIGVYSGITTPVAGQPSGVSINDIYLWMTTASKVLANGTTQTYDVTRTYKYSGSAWVEVTTNSNITALADLADGKRTVFSGSTIPTGAVARDIWIPSATNGSYLKGEIYQYTGTAWVLATRYSADIEAVRSNLQSQVDGKVETYYSSTVPVGMTIINNGDYWYCTADVSTYKKGKVYKYVHSTTSWTETADVSRYAFDLADGKASIFSSTSVPTTGYKINDMLIVIGSFNNGTTTFSDGVVLSSTATRASGFTASDWVKKINDTEKLDAFVDNIYTPAVTDLQSQVDKQVSYYFYASLLGETKESVSGSNSWTTEAKKEHHGDIAYDRTTNTGYYYDKSISSWIEITGSENAGVIEALKAASIAQATADGKVSHMYGVYQNSTPTTDGSYKYWLTSSKVLKVLSGTSWVDFAISKLDTGDIVTVWDSVLKDEFKYYWNGSTWYSQANGGLVAGSKAFTDLDTSLGALGTTVSGHTGQLSTVDSRIVNGVATVESKWQYNSNLIINGVSYNSGFGLSNSAGTGAGSEFWIDASRFKFTNSAKTGSTAPFTIKADGASPEITFNGKVNFSNVVDVSGQYVNMIKNSEFQNSVNPWAPGWNPNGSVIEMFGLAENIHEPAWIIKGTTGSLTLFQNNRNSSTENDDIAIDLYPTSVYDSAKGFSVIAGETYEFSVYAAAHRCDVQLIIHFFDTNLHHITGITTGRVYPGNGGDSIESYSRVHIRMVAPPGARTALLVFRKHNTNPGVDLHSWIWIARPFFGMVSANSAAPVAYVASDSVESLYTPGTTTINGETITTGSIKALQIAANSISADKIYSDSALINKLNVTGGIVSNNIVVNGINGNNPLFSASGDKVVISNLKVLGTVSMPGISKGGSFTVPNLVIGSTHTVYVSKPYECSSWSLTAIVTLTNGNGSGTPLNFGCRLYVDGILVSTAASVGAWAINIGCSGTKGSVYANTIPISIQTAGFGDGAGGFSGTISYIAIVEN